MATLEMRVRVQR